MAYTNISREELQTQNLGQDLPILLNFTPSVVTTSDAGAGVGYTGIRIRGSDATRINLTINGIPLNDAESQGTFLVNLPDFASSIQSLQIQRGVGSSTNGAGSFGGSINIQTNQLSEEAFAEVSNSVGSFNTWKHTIRVGSGLIADKFTLDARLSKISSDGFIDRAFSDLKSFYLSGAYYGKKTTLRANIFSGKEQTFQAWYGIPEARLKGDLQGMDAYIDRNFLSDNQIDNLFNSDSRTYNSQTYDNETDNYQQDHYQFFITQSLAKNWNLNVALHYTRGKGYFEQYREEDSLEDYGLPNVSIGNETIANSDLIRRRWLDNHFYGTVFSLNHQTKRSDFTLGGALNKYLGDHYGEIIWARYAVNSSIRDRYYENDAEKTDFNIFWKVNHQLTDKLSALVDLQYRRVFYSFLGNQVDSQGTRNVQQNVLFDFFNPKIGLNYALSPLADVYASLSVGSKEPNRDDFTQSSPDSRPNAEKLYDVELGYRQRGENLTYSFNAYGMFYQDQLILTGEVNDVGAFNRSNVDKSYRIGIEAEAVFRLNKKLTWSVNATLSQNKIQNFREYVDFYGTTEEFPDVQAQGFEQDENTGQLFKELENTDIAFSPNLITASQLQFQPFKGFEIALLSKYVGQQYLDNTSSELRKLDAFFTNDIRLSYQMKTSLIPEMRFTLLLNNVLNEEYESNGYTYGYFLGSERISENFYFPQADTNFLLGVSLLF
jgi:iron complex outermembrane receptor protein